MDGTDQTCVKINEKLQLRKSFFDSKPARGNQQLSGNINWPGRHFIRLSASADSPVEVFCDLVTDGIGEITLETAAQGKKNIDLTINFTQK